MSFRSTEVNGFLKMGRPWPLFRLFKTFQTNVTIFITNKFAYYRIGAVSAGGTHKESRKKYVKCLSSIWCWDSNPRPSEHESPHTTTRPASNIVNNLFVYVTIALA